MRFPFTGHTYFQRERLCWQMMVEICTLQSNLAGFGATSKIEIVNEVRSATSLGLKEAKKLVESALVSLDFDSILGSLASTFVSSSVSSFWGGIFNCDCKASTVASNKARDWYLKQEIQELKGKLRALNEETYIGCRVDVPENQRLL